MGARPALVAALAVVSAALAGPDAVSAATSGGVRAVAPGPPPPTRAVARLAGYLGRQARAAGRASGAYAVDLTTGRVLLARSPGVARVPASVQKLLTTSTALAALGPSAQLRTTVMGAGAREPDGTWRGDLYLRGGGDPTFGSQAFAARAYRSSASVEALARQLAEQVGLVRVTGRIIGDESAWDGLRGGPASSFAVSTYVGPLSALAFDRGLADARGSAFQRRPPAFAAARLDAALEQVGVAVERPPATGVAPPEAPELATVLSPSVRRLVRITNVTSDNFVAEMLLKGLGARVLGVGSTQAGARVVRSRAARSRVRAVVADGSGLSRANRVAPREVVRLLTAVRARPEGPALMASLPVAGRSGTLANRMRGTVAQGRCRAKTGTLTGVAGLAGFCDTVGGHTVAFAFLMNGVGVTAARRLQDRMTVALAGASLGGLRR